MIVAFVPFFHWQRAVTGTLSLCPGRARWPVAFSNLPAGDHSKAYADTASTAVIAASVPFFHWHGQSQGHSAYVLAVLGGQLRSQTCLQETIPKAMAGTASKAVIVASVPFFHWHGQLQGTFRLCPGSARWPVAFSNLPAGNHSKGYAGTASKALTAASVPFLPLAGGQSQGHSAYVLAVLGGQLRSQTCLQKTIPKAVLILLQRQWLQILLLSSIGTGSHKDIPLMSWQG